MPKMFAKIDLPLVVDYPKDGWQERLRDEMAKLAQMLGVTTEQLWTVLLSEEEFMPKTFWHLMEQADLSRGSANPQSQAAHAKLARHKQTLREIVLELVTAAGVHGVTCEEAADKMKKRPHEVSGRFTELCAINAIRPNGHVRKTVGGNAATVWVLM